MPTTVDPNKASADALQALKDAMTPVAKSMGDDLADATLAHNDAIKADIAYDALIAKAGGSGVPPSFAKKPAPPAGAVAPAPAQSGETPPSQPGTENQDRGIETEGAKPPAAPVATEGTVDADCDDAAKAQELLDLSKAGHDLVDAYLTTADDTAAKAEGKDTEWTALAAKVHAYHAAREKVLIAKAAEIATLVKVQAETLTKADSDEKKVASAMTSAGLQAWGDATTELATLTKGYIANAVYPPVEMKLEKAASMADGKFPIQTKADVLAAMEAYKRVQVTDQPPVYAHIMNAAAALNQKLPDGWHHPVTLPGDPSKTTRVTDLTAADKAAAMKKGIFVVGPLAHMLGQINLLKTSDKLFNDGMLKAESVDPLKAWLDAGEIMMKGLIEGEVPSISILAIDTFPEPVLKADSWASAGAKVVMASIKDDMDDEQKEVRKNLATRLDAAHNFFIAKAAGSDDDLKKVAGEVVTLKEDLAKVAGERDVALENLTTFATQVGPMAKIAAGYKEEIKKLGDENTSLKKRVVDLEAEPMPAKGRVGEADDLNKAAGIDTGSIDAMLTTVRAMPAGLARSNKALELAHKMRLREQLVPDKSRLVRA